MDNTKLAAEKIQKVIGDFQPKVGLVLGSGLGVLAKDIQPVAVFPYEELPGFWVSEVPGHASQFILGYLNGVPVACMSGRVHAYEDIQRDHLLTPIRTIKRLGCHTLVFNSATGSLNREVEPGNVMLIKDHINFTGWSILVGPNNPEYGPRFVPLENAYDERLRQQFKEEGAALGIPLTEGVYVGVRGPNYETPAEIRFYASAGGSVIGMSTVQEVIAARHCGLKVAVLAVVTNYGAGLSEQVVSHEEVLHFSHVAANKLIQLIKATINRIEA